MSTAAPECLPRCEPSLTEVFASSLRLKLSPSPSAQVSVSRVSGSSSRSSKRKRGEAKDIPEVGGEGKLLVSEEASASGAVSIAPSDMTGNAVTLSNDSEQVCPPQLRPLAVVTVVTVVTQAHRRAQAARTRPQSPSFNRPVWLLCAGPAHGQLALEETSGLW